MAITEAAFREASGDRRQIAKRIEDAQNRLTEVTALLDRFSLLRAHYQSDVERLGAIAEAGSLFAALGEADCPLCGAATKDHRRGSDCDGDVDKVVAAARAEIAKITPRQAELGQTIRSLRDEAVSFERRLPAMEARLTELSGEIEAVVAPNLKQLRVNYRELADKSGEVREALAIHRGLVDLEERKAKLEREDPDSGSGSTTMDVDLSTTTVDKFATLVLDILRAWHFPEIDRVHFDMKVRDLVINGKARTSFGKGLRAITQTAFTVGLLEFCNQHNTPHPGFVVVDSPLLSYREPEGSADDLRGTDLNDHFYDYLANWLDERQIIVIENTDPPKRIVDGPRATMFSGLAGVERFGLFPQPDDETQPEMELT